MIIHLAVSTLVLALALMLARVLPMQARTRHTAILIGIGSFAVPYPSLPAPAVPHHPAIISIAGLARDAVPLRTHSGTTVVLSIWISVAAVLAVMLIARRRRLALLLSSARPAPLSVQAMLDPIVAASSMRSIRLVESDSFQSPAVVGIFKPTVVIPATLADLDDGEIETLLLHETAHISRHDNLTTLVAELAGAILWFHPLIWLARRALAIAREEACDEWVIRRRDITTYLRALGKVCTAATGNLSGASSMADSRLKERIENMRTIDRIHPLPHRFVLFLCCTLVAVAAFAGSAVGSAANASGKYAIAYTVTLDGNPKMVVVSARISDPTGNAAAQPTITTPPGVPASIVANMGDDHVEVAIVPDSTGSEGTVTMDVVRDGKTIQHTQSRWNVSGPPVSTSDGITLNLKDADIRDVLNVFAKLSNRKVEIDSDVQGSITLDLRNVPWTEGLQQAVSQVGAKARIDSDTIHVTK